MSKIAQIRERRQRAHRQLLDSNSKVYQAFLQMESATYADGALSQKTKELVAVGISVVIDCESCMEWHISQASRDGASREEILEAVEVAIEMAGGPATALARFALDVMDDVFPDPNKAQPKRRRIDRHPIRLQVNAEDLTG
jgi:AhpD family alkylhydroperoxidase